MKKWIILAYTLPPEPSRKRVAVWRRLRKLGAVYMNEGFWFLPSSPALLAAIEEVSTGIRNEGGTASSFEASCITAPENDVLLERFTEARRAEYEEVARQCDRFLGHLERARESGEFSFAKTEEFEEDLEKRTRWLAQVRERDFLGVEGYTSVAEKLEHCRRALESFVQAAFEKQSAHAE
jgi:hypothetical protein